MGSLNSMPNVVSVFNGLVFMVFITIILAVTIGVVIIYEKISKRNKGDKLN